MTSLVGPHVKSGQENKEVLISISLWIDSVDGNTPAS